MQRPDKLYAISRRAFCTIAGAGGLGLVIAGCGNSGGGGSPDASPADASAAVCTTDGMDVGPASAFVVGTPVYIDSGLFYVVRDSGGLYAMSALCTHQGALTCIGTAAGCTATGANVIFCPRHGAVFSFDGTVVRGPAARTLDHFAMCDLSNGHVGVLASVKVAASVRLAG
jgi:Rieske Fe-S protein